MVVPAFAPISEVVCDTETAWLFPAGDRRACIDKVIEIYQNKKAQRRVGQQARRYIETERQWLHNAQQILCLVKK
jgi:glycosyltransferase involved in cell wall biosynthesis